MVIFAERVAHLATLTSGTDPRAGELFFASSDDLVGRFDYARDPQRVVIDLSSAPRGDASSVAALDAKYRRRGKDVDIVGLDERSALLHGTLSGELSV
ncbi:hypothetical protein ACIA6C_20975 [Streptomyces sp. NPDC051578]|uniref:hypothetical protein n=1 Tax=Streptomyces sp. NPDC051578 TaxID=3365662 RepID=UPI0037984EA5